jgi:hypothetical protein
MSSGRDDGLSGSAAAGETACLMPGPDAAFFPVTR